MASHFSHPDHQPGPGRIQSEMLVASEQYYGGGAPPRSWPDMPQGAGTLAAHAEMNGAGFHSYAPQSYYRPRSPTRGGGADSTPAHQRDFSHPPPPQFYPQSTQSHPSHHTYQPSISFEPRLWPPAAPSPAHDDASWRPPTSMFGESNPAFGQEFGGHYRGEVIEALRPLGYSDGGLTRSATAPGFGSGRAPDPYDYPAPYHGGARTQSLPGPSGTALLDPATFPRRSSHPPRSPSNTSYSSHRPTHQPSLLHYPPPVFPRAPTYSQFQPQFLPTAHPQTPPLHSPSQAPHHNQSSLLASANSAYSFDFVSPETHSISSHASSPSVVSLASPPPSFSFVKPEDLESATHSRHPSHSGSRSPAAASPDLAIHLAASLRIQYHRSALPLAFNPARTPNASTLAASLDGKPASTYSRPGRGKPILELETSCWTCGEPGPKLVVRGEKLDWPAKATFSCIACAAVPQEDDEEPPPEESEEPTYKDTLSAAVDAFQGLEEEEDQGPPLTESSPTLPVELKGQALHCDVCSRLIGAGKVTAVTSGKAPAFTTEVVCARCQKLYKPCSDCGGGGGRLTSGRWRCKELFPEGRRTCRLSHHRMPPIAEISYEVHRIEDVAPSTAEDLEKKCREVYFNSRLGVIARPDSLERGDGLARTFLQVERGTIDQWHLLAPLLQERDMEASQGRRRYLAIQSAPQQGRRPRGKVEVVPTIDSGDSPPPSDRSMTGFMLVEHDLANGTLLWACSMPWVLSGPSFDASTELGGLAVQRARADLFHTNREREAQGLAPFPPIQYLWLLSPFQSESKWAKSLALRNYRPAAEVALEEPNFPFHAFPPHRDVFIPSPFLMGFQLFVRKLESEHDVGGQPETPRKKRTKRA